MPLPLVLKGRKYINTRPDLCIMGDDCDKMHFVHKIVMICASPYFEKVFEYCSLDQVTVELDQKPIVIDLLRLSHVSRHIITGIISFAYTGQVKINTSNVQELMVSADMLCILGLLKQCISFCEQTMNTENCIGLFVFADHLQCQQLLKTSLTFILQNFETLINESEELFTLTSASFLKKLFESNLLYVSNEIVLWNCLLKWIKQDETQRLKYFPDLCQSLRLGAICIRHLQAEVLLHPFVVQNKETKSLVNDVVNALISLESTENIDHKLLVNTQVKKQLTPRYPHDIVLVFGGRALELEFVSPESIVEAYDYRLERWKNVDIADPTGPRDHHQVTVHGLDVYVIGGHQGPFNVFNSCRKFNMQTKTWSEIAPMLEKRAFLAAVSLSKYVYAIGGYNGAWRVKTVERYDTNLNQWTLVADMHERRSGAGAAVLNDNIYVVGGFRDLSYLNSAECYNSESNQWTLISPMNKPRSSPSVVAYEMQVYAIGGLCSNGLIANGERYDTESGIWVPLEDEMREQKCGAAAVVLDNKIFVIGGWNGVGGLKTVEIWSSQTKKWVLGSKLLKRRTGCAACVVCKVANIEEFTFTEREAIVEEALLHRVTGANKSKDTSSVHPITQQTESVQQRSIIDAVGGVDNGQHLNDWFDVD